MVKSSPLPPVKQDDPPLVALLCAAAGEAGNAVRLILELDQRCAAIVRGTQEMMMGQIRLAWWREALALEATQASAAPEPLLADLRAHPRFGAMALHLQNLLDGWEAFLIAAGQEDDATLRAYAEGRGAGLFGAMDAAMGGATDVGQSGALWALWDLAGHVSDAGLANRAITLAADYPSMSPLPRPLAMLRAVALPDVRAGRVPPPHLTPRRYLRLLRAQLFGR